MKTTSRYLPTPEAIKALVDCENYSGHSADRTKKELRLSSGNKNAARVRELIKADGSKTLSVMYPWLVADIFSI